MSSYPRYALYFIPPHASSIYRLGAAVLGYDAYEARVLPFPQAIVNAHSDWPAVVRAPRTYGFHATLKAPFALAIGRTEHELCEAFRSFLRGRRSVPVILPTIRALSGFIAIVPARPSDALEALAVACLETFDSFRASLSDEDRARRNPAMLTERQAAALERWGYPFVKEDFRFHMTLTGRLPEARLGTVVASLQEAFGALLTEDFPVEHLALSRQDAPDRPFHVLLAGTVGSV